jgi:hypothetical protein
VPRCAVLSRTAVLARRAILAEARARGGGALVAEPLASAVIAAATGCGVARRPILTGRSVATVAASEPAAVAGTAPVAESRSSAPVAIAVAECRPIAERPVTISGGRGRKWCLRSCVPLGGCSAERRPRRGHDPGGLGAHPEDATAARREDLEVEVVEAGAERLSSVAEGFLDRLPGEFLVRTHVSVVSLGGPGDLVRADGPSQPPMRLDRWGFRAVDRSCRGL